MTHKLAGCQIFIQQEGNGRHEIKENKVLKFTHFINYSWSGCIEISNNLPFTRMDQFPCILIDFKHYEQKKVPKVHNLVQIHEIIVSKN